MTTTIDPPKPIPTHYEGRMLRSRLEARWAHFFSLMGEPAQYEAEAFALPCGPYLPDYWLPRQRTWLELKGQAPTALERKLCQQLCEARGERVILAYGTFGSWLDPEQQRWDPFSALAWVPERDPDGHTVAATGTRFWPCVCPTCDRFGFAFEGDGGIVCAQLGIACETKEKSYTFNDPRLLKVIQMAQAESFWR